MKATTILASVAISLLALFGCGGSSDDPTDFVNADAKAAGDNNLFLALDCRNPPNTLACNRVWVQVRTSKAKERVKVAVKRWAAKTNDGWVYFKLPKLRFTSLSSPRAAPGNPSWSQKQWVGTVRDAVVGLLQVPLKGKLPEGRERWVGNNPPIRADIVVATEDSDGAGGTETYRQVVLLAGHG